MLLALLTGILHALVNLAHAGDFTLPVSDTDFRVNVTSGWAYQGGGAHYGIDYDGADGCFTPVRATSDGTVTFRDDVCSEDEQDFGCTVEITHASGLQSKYSHLCAGADKIPVSVGEVVTRGQIIGYVGNTGFSSGSHLDFRVRNPATCSVWLGPCLIDPYDIGGGVDFKGPEYYPDTYVSAECGPDHLWTECPPVSYGEAGVCESELHTVYGDPVDMRMVVLNPELSDPPIPDEDDPYDIHMYYEEGATGDLTLLNRGDMGDQYVNPVINDQARVLYKRKWLVGDVGSPSGERDGWDDVVLIAHQTDGDNVVQVWLNNGDGSLQTRELWHDLGSQKDEYFLGARGALIYGKETADGIDWYKCTTNEVNGFNDCDFWGDTSGAVDEDVYLTGDFDGDGRTDLLRGYDTESVDEYCPLDPSSRKLRWRVMLGGDSHLTTWRDAWGCQSSDYLVGDTNGDGRDDLIQVRHDSEYTAPVFVALSDGSDFDESSEWRSDFGSDYTRYWSHDVDGDGYDDLVMHNNHTGRMYLMKSDGVDAFVADDRLIATGLDKEPYGAFRFGDFGQLALAIGEEEVEVCDGGIGMAGIMGDPGDGGDIGGDTCAMHPSETTTPIVMVWEPALGDFYWIKTTGEELIGTATPSLTDWATNPGDLDYQSLYADVTGDDVPDLVNFHSPTGDWTVAIGDGFGNFFDDGVWLEDYGSTVDPLKYQAFLGDVNADGYNDVVIYEHGLGYWYTVLNTGTSFEVGTGLLSLSSWGVDAAGTKYEMFVADVTGNGIVEFVAYEHGLGYWHVASAVGDGTYAHDGLWASGWATSPEQNTYICDLVDVDADGDADVVAHEHEAGAHHVMLSDGTTFLDYGTYVDDWATSSGDPRRYVSIYQDVNIDGILDLVLWEPALGNWHAALGAEGSFDPEPSLWLDDGADESFDEQYTLLSAQ